MARTNAKSKPKASPAKPATKPAAKDAKDKDKATAKKAAAAPAAEAKDKKVVETKAKDGKPAMLAKKPAGGGGKSQAKKSRPGDFDYDPGDADEGSPFGTPSDDDDEDFVKPAKAPRSAASEADAAAMEAESKRPAKGNGASGPQDKMRDKLIALGKQKGFV